jgi:16S rRNA (guanine966-N2)-methyltransferase
MRIVSGTYGGRRLETPKNDAIRPTSDKIRGAVFNILRGNAAVDGAHVWDAFCGSGALGLEALSQGAASCVFSDKNRQSLDLTKRNAEMLGADARAEFILKDAAKLQHDGEPFDLVFLDPPYKQDLIVPVLTQIRSASLVSDHAVIMIETEKRWDETSVSEFLSIETLKKYGETKIMIGSVI